jgi:LEA14-like dessication related protein
MVAKPETGRGTTLSDVHPGAPPRGQPWIRLVARLTPGRRPGVHLLIAAVLLSSCATLRNALNFQEPQIQLQEINITGMGLSGGTLDLVFDVYNPNDYRLRSTRLEVGLDLEGTHFGDALIDRPLDLSPTNHSRVVMPVRFEWAGVGAAARGLLTRQALKYGVTGAVLLDTPLGDKRVQLRGSGDVPLRKLM